MHNGRDSAGMSGLFLWGENSQLNHYDREKTKGDIMVLAELIESIRVEKPNAFTPEKLTAFVNDIEADVAEILGTQIVPYDYAEDSGMELLARPPYDRLYKSYVKAMIDYANEEYQSYQNNVAQHTQDFREFTDFVVREDAGAKKGPRRFVRVD